MSFNNLKILVRQKGETAWREYPGNMTHVQAVKEHAAIKDATSSSFESKFSNGNCICQHRVTRQSRYEVEPLRND